MSLVSRLVAAVSLIVALGITVGCEDDSGESASASDYGVTDPNKAALVLRDESPAYQISFAGELDRNSSRIVSFGAPPSNDGEAVYEISPGEHLLKVDLTPWDYDVLEFFNGDAIIINVDAGEVAFRTVVGNSGSPRLVK